MHVKKGDKVIVITGAYKGQSGAVVKVFTKNDKIVVEGINKKKKHQRAQKGGTKGQIIEKTMPIHVSNVRKA